MLAMLIQAVVTDPKPRDDLPLAIPTKISPADAAAQAQAGSIFGDPNLRLTQIILIFAVLALLFLYLMCRSERRDFELRIFTITILVFGSLLVVTAGFGKDTLAPVIGFFGTIAGYVLGRGERRDERNETRLLEDKRNERS